MPGEGKVKLWKVKGEQGRRNKIGLDTDIGEVKPKLETLCNPVIFHMVKKEGLHVADNVSCLPHSHSLPFSLLTKPTCFGAGNVPSSKDWIVASLIDHDFNVSS